MPESTNSVPHVFTAINTVQAALAKEGIAKGRKNQQQGYAFRGIDDVYASLSQLLAENSLLMLPNYTARTVSERETKTGGALFNVVLLGSFTFISAKDGTTTTVSTFGEAMDSADKATNKAMSAAYKYAAIQSFCIPTEGDNDADATTHEVKGRSPTNAGVGMAGNGSPAKSNGKATSGAPTAPLGNFPITAESKKKLASFRATEAGEAACIALLKEWKLVDFDEITESEAKTAIAWIEAEVKAATKGAK
jgi:hypothetical protein